MLRAIAPQHSPVVVLHERGDEPLLVAVDLLVVLHQLLVEHVQQRLAGDVGDVVGARRRGAAERAGAELALGAAVEGDAVVLEPQHLVGRLAAHDLDRVLVAEVVRALDGVVGVRLPRVVGVQRGVDAARGRVGVRADRVDLAHDGDGRPGARGGERSALAGQSGADDEDVVCGHGGRVYKPYGPLRRPAQRGADRRPVAVRREVACAARRRRARPLELRRGRRGRRWRATTNRGRRDQPARDPAMSKIDMELSPAAIGTPPPPAIRSPAASIRSETRARPASVRAHRDPARHRVPRGGDSNQV